MTDRSDEPLLLTPGPLTTDRRTREAMLRDWGSRDRRFIAINAEVRQALVDIIHGGDEFVAVPLQGSGTFVVEAALGTLIPRAGAKALVLINGAYGKRMTKMLDYLGRPYVTYETAEDVRPDPAEIDRRLGADPAITHVLMVHCETTSGIENPLAEIAAVVARRNKSLIVDSMSIFGVAPLDARTIRFDAVMASSNKCLEGPPGMGFALIRKSVLEKAQGNAHSLSLDLHDQWVNMEKTKQWRFTPPTHVIAGFHRAVELYKAEGGQPGRLARYRENCRILVEGMRTLGFETLLPDATQAPIIVTFHTPADPKFDFQHFYDQLSARGFVIYPGKLTVADSFRIGCIGHLDATDMRAALAAIKAVLDEQGVRSGAPARRAA